MRPTPLETVKIALFPNKINVRPAIFEINLQGVEIAGFLDKAENIRGSFQEGPKIHAHQNNNDYKQ